MKFGVKKIIFVAICIFLVKISIADPMRNNRETASQKAVELVK